MPNLNYFKRKYPSVVYPEYQRAIDWTHVNEIVADVKSIIAEDGIQPAMNLILICRYLINNIPTYDIVDGQHRLEAIAQLATDGIPIAFHIGFVDVRSSQEAEKRYLMFNRSKNHSDTLGVVHQDNKNKLMKECRQWLLSTYSKVFVTGATRRPCINVDDFIDTFVESDYYPNTNTLADFQQTFVDYNDYLTGLDINTLKIGKVKIVDRTVNQIRAHGIYFAFFCKGDYFSMR